MPLTVRYITLSRDLGHPAYTQYFSNSKLPDFVFKNFAMLFDQTDAHAKHTAAEDGEHTPIEKKLSRVEIPIYNDVERVSSPDLSLGAILKGTAANPLTTFEKKAALINAELDNFGLGRYQICIWFLCGFGYFLDLAWSQGVGLIASAVYQEMDVPDARTGDIWSLANAGLAVGALSFGLLVDIIGRKWAFNLTCLITSIFGLLIVRLGFSSVQLDQSAKASSGSS